MSDGRTNNDPLSLIFLLARTAGTRAGVGGVGVGERVAQTPATNAIESNSRAAGEHLSEGDDPHASRDGDRCREPL